MDRTPSLIWPELTVDISCADGRSALCSLGCIAHELRTVVRLWRLGCVGVQA